MKEAIATLRSKHAEFFNSAKVQSTFVSAKKYKGQAENVEDGYFYCDVPTVVTYKDDFGKTKILFENYAQFLLNAYSNKLELVVVKEKEIMETPIVKAPAKKVAKAPVVVETVVEATEPVEAETEVPSASKVVPKRKGKKDEITE